MRLVVHLLQYENQYFDYISLAILLRKVNPDPMANVAATRLLKTSSAPSIGEVSREEAPFLQLRSFFQKLLLRANSRRTSSRR